MLIGGMWQPVLSSTEFRDIQGRAIMVADTGSCPTLRSEEAGEDGLIGVISMRITIALWIVTKSVSEGGAVMA